jgi:hypothetical protein
MTLHEEEKLVQRMIADNKRAIRWGKDRRLINKLYLEEELEELHQDLDKLEEEMPLRVTVK